MKAMETIRHNKELVQQARSAFVRRVNIVVEEHEVATTDTFKVGQLLNDLASVLPILAR
ncbi:hypothetical protein BVRB_2g043140 isoform A [Beta vulgaris subsp. vulgaris]|nr:hypothetical protein BVRB_2g043140 isoform A [Beta vulgaris subsp. vulgaris]